MTLQSLSERLWATQLAADPVRASLMGFHDHDDQLGDLSASGLDELAADYRSMAEDARAIDPEPLDPQERVTRELAIHLADVSAREAADRYVTGAVDTYTGAATGLLLAIASLSSSSQSESEAYLQRWGQTARYLNEALELNRAELAKGRKPAHIVVSRVLDMIDGYLGSPLGEDSFVKASLHPDAGEEIRTQLEQVVADVVRPAYASYREAVADEFLPVAKPDATPGLAHNPDGDRVYAELVEMYTSIAVDPEDLHEFGLAEATEKLPEEWASIGEAALGLSDLPSLFDRLRNDPELSYGNAEDMLQHARTTVDRAWSEIDDWFGARPESPCDVVEVPAELAKDLPPAFYMTPSSDGARPGLYYLNTHDPSSRKRFIYESIHYHEAIPGHHFDRSLSMELEGIPEFRKRFPSFAMAEGWGLYSERLADEMGLYSSQLDRLGMLSADAWRAGRLVVDTGMHAMGWSRDQAIEWMLKWTPNTLPVIEQEIDRYIGMPAQALAYKTGQREILRLRGEAEKRLGSRFVIADFHDALLTSGGLTLTVLAGVIEEWLSAADG